VEPSFTSCLLEAPDITPDKEHDIKWSAFSLYAGGADTASFLQPTYKLQFHSMDE